jgi:hypothetical protein
MGFDMRGLGPSNKLKLMAIQQMIEHTVALHKFYDDCKAGRLRKFNVSGDDCKPSETGEGSDGGCHLK